MTNVVRINSIVYNRSLVNGPGVRTLVFFQGCDIKCDGCHNPITWDQEDGTNYDIDKLVDELLEKTKNKKVTLTGGEPFLQKDAVIALSKRLHELEFDVCIYTGHTFDEVPEEILPFLKYIKVGKYDKTKHCTTKPYIGSLNQAFRIL